MKVSIAHMKEAVDSLQTSDVLLREGLSQKANAEDIELRFGKVEKWIRSREHSEEKFDNLPPSSSSDKTISPNSTVKSFLAPVLENMCLSPVSQAVTNTTPKKKQVVVKSY